MNSEWHGGTHRARPNPLVPGGRMRVRPDRYPLATIGMVDGKEGLLEAQVILRRVRSQVSHEYVDCGLLWDWPQRIAQ